MRAGFDRDGAEGVGRVDLEGRRLDARPLRVGGVHDLDGVLVPLRPAQVHAHEHLGEVGGVVAARAGADRDDRGPLVVLAVEQRLHLELVDEVGESGQFGTRLLCGVLVAHLVRETDEHLEVVETLRDPGDPGELGLAVAECAGHLLRVLGVVPEVGGTGLLAETRDVLAETGDIDDLADVAEGVPERLDFGGEI